MNAVARFLFTLLLCAALFLQGTDASCKSAARGATPQANCPRTKPYYCKSLDRGHGYFCCQKKKCRRSPRNCCSPHA